MHHSIEKNTIDNFMALSEPAFYYGLKNSSKVPDSLLPNRVLNYFEYSLKQNPEDLSLHLQRIQFVLTVQDKEELYAALCDLFIILGSQGLLLRQRLFAYSKRKLDQKQIDVLTNHLTEDYLTSDMQYLPSRCFFKTPPIELIKLFDQLESDVQEIEDVLHTADSYIENSQFDTAKEYITEHLERDLDNEALTIKLISLYVAIGDENDFQNAFNKFANNLMTSRHWDDAQQYFLKQ